MEDGVRITASTHPGWAIGHGKTSVISSNTHMRTLVCNWRRGITVPLLLLTHMHLMRLFRPLGRIAAGAGSL